MCRATIYDARNKFSSLVRLAESGEPVELTRHDKPVAVIISWEEYEKRRPREDFFKWLERFKKENADLYEDGEFDEGLPLPPKDYLDEAYMKRIDAMWGGE